MRLGMSSAANGEPSVAVAREGQWVPLRTVPGADRLGPVTTDLLALLAEHALGLTRRMAARIAA
jgi:hypothetical protein